ncbi:MAG: hypothetical protein R2883_00375 [Caldisericia bacterium]
MESSQLRAKIKSSGKFTNNGQMNVYPTEALCPEFENTSYVSAQENLIITSMDGFTNTVL